MNATLPSTALRGQLKYDEPLARYTSWRCGGSADRVYIPADRKDLATFVAQLPCSEPLLLLGLGSNVLVRDGGVRGTVIVMSAALNVLRMRDGLIYAEAGVASPKVARLAAKHGRAEAEFLAGIPGTVGGALAMNAGCYGGETWRYVAKAEVLTRDGAFEERRPADYTIGYRTVKRIGSDSTDSLFTAAWFGFPIGDSQAAQARIKELLQKRMATQPLDLPNAGSVFRNPPGDHAARLIESCGLKGYPLGHARISEKHANFIVNPHGEARAADIEALIGLARKTVREKTGIELEPEVRILGETAS